MKLRRAMAVAAATAVMAPATFLAASAAQATENTGADGQSSSVSPSISPSASTSVAPSGSASTPAPENSSPTTGESSPGTESSSPAPESSSPGPSVSTSPAASGSTSPSPSASLPNPSPGEPEPEESEEEGEEGEEFPDWCEESTVAMSLTGLPGKIAAGSGWHKFTITTRNNSQDTLAGVAYFAGASGDRMGEELFNDRQVRLQALDPDSGTWQDLQGEDGIPAGFAGWSDELKPGHKADISLRINVLAGAPAGAAFTLGASLYMTEDGSCEGVGEVSYRFEIVKAGTNTDGTKPQEGGRAPVPTKKPVAVGTGTGSKVTGTLAATGSDSVLPVIGIVGGIAVVAGAGVVFAVKRRREDATA
ncbi:LPXTG cell wall anchor domain-containing protein [Streptomyces sp. NPDC001889]